MSCYPIASKDVSCSPYTIEKYLANYKGVLKYYYRRGNRFFFRNGKQEKLIIHTSEEVANQLKELVSKTKTFNVQT